MEEKKTINQDLPLMFLRQIGQFDDCYTHFFRHFWWNLCLHDRYGIFVSGLKSKDTFVDSAKAYWALVRNKTLSKFYLVLWERNPRIFLPKSNIVICNKRPSNYSSSRYRSNEISIHLLHPLSMSPFPLFSSQPLSFPLLFS